jgi:putative tricarboxylic transport membrane protein
MDTWIYLSQGFAVAMTPENLLIALIGCFVGTIVGLLPGLGLSTAWRSCCRWLSPCTCPRNRR